jgi:hypothetical protein
MLRAPCAVACFLAACALTGSSQPPGEPPKDKKGDKKGPPRFELGKVFPPPLREELNLTKEQEKQLADIEAELRDKLNKLLTDEQKKTAESFRPGGPGGPGGGPGGPGGPGGGPGGGAPALDTTSKPAFGSGKENPGPAAPAGVKQLAGRWYIKEGKDGKPNVYLYRDADKYVDLFALTGDSNKDGIPDLKVSHDDKAIILESQNLPNHPTAKFPNSGNPNTIRAQNFRFRIPLVPRPAERITPPPMGPVGVAINGVVFFNPFEAGGMNAVAGYSEVWFDSCCGHPEQRGAYHYHKYPSCVKTPFPDDGKGHSPVVGFAFDGYPLYGPYVADGVMAKDLKGADALDVCNGRFDPDRGYHYHVTPDKFPYLIGGYAGVVEENRGPGRGGVGALKDNTSGESREGAGIAAVKPGTADRGKTHTVRIELNAPAARVPEAVPSRVVVGPFEGAKIARDGNVVTCELTIPANANRGALHDCHIEWDTANRVITVKKNNVFRDGGE